VSAGPAAAHRPTIRRSPSQRPPRRVSGPARGRVSTRPAAGTVALPQPAQPLAPRLVDILVGLPDARWLDRLMRGRAWIAIIAFALIGLVFMQVSMLGMNAGIGQKVERASTLERAIADERAAVSALSRPERIQSEAARAGMIQPKPGDVTYLRSRGSRTDGAVAAKTMTAPSPEATAAVTGAENTAAATGALPPTDAALQAQNEEAATADTVPGAQTQAEQPQAAAQAQVQPQQQATPTATPQTQQQTATPTQQVQPQQPTPAATAQTQQQPQATGATAAPAGQ
jgi:hypothetical protein